MKFNLNDTHVQMALDFTASVLAGAGLALVQYLLSDQPVDWRPLAAAVLVGVIAAARKWAQTKITPPPEPPFILPPHG